MQTHTTLYAPPEVKVVEAKPRQIICTSPEGTIDPMTSTDETW